MKLEFVGQSSRDPDNWQASSSRLINCYLEPSEGKTGSALKSVLGTTAFVTLPGVFMRAIEAVDGVIYALVGAEFHSITTGGVSTSLGAVVDSANASISGNNGDVTACIGGDYYLWNGATLTSPASGAFSSFGSVEYIGNYTVLTELNGRRFQWSAIADATSLPGLNFSTADGRDDNILRAAAINGLLYIFKETSHEIWYLTGGASAAAFERQTGGVVETGLLAFGLLAKIDGSAFFVGDDGRAHIVGVGPVSTPAVETAIKSFGPRSCVTYEDEGHTFCAIVFDDCAAWVYDIATGSWHERATGADFLPWTVRATAKIGGQWYAGRDGGAVVTMSRNNLDEGLDLVRAAVSRTLENDGQFIRLSELEVFVRTGFSAGTVELRLSKDNGHTWTPPRDVSWALGEYDRRTRWKALGTARQWTAEIRISGSADIPLNSAGRVRVA